MLQPPKQLQDNLPNNKSKEEVEDWWYNLEHLEKEALYYLYDEERQDKEVEIEWRGAFVEEEDYNNELWTIGGLYMYMVNHELYIKDVSVVVGGICTAHPEAVKVGQKGVLPASFCCPLDKKDCPIRQILDLRKGKSLKLFPHLKKKKK